MALGSITSLGVGSGFELQSMLDNLRSVDEKPITLKKTTKERIEKQVTELDLVNTKLIQMKSSALALSLESNFNDREIGISDESITQATVQTGTPLSGYSLDIQKLATKSSWQSAGVESQDAAMYTEPSSAIASKTTPAINEPDTLSFSVATDDGAKQIDLNFAAGASLEEIADSINNATENLKENGTTHVTATIENGNNGYYIRLAATDDDTTQNHQILISDSPDFISADLSFSYQTGASNTPTYISVAPGTSYQEMVSTINEDPNNSGIQAAMINDGSSDNPWHFTLTAKNSGEENRIFLTNLQMTEKQGAENESLNASFSVNGFEYQRQANDDLNDVIQGVSFNLKKIGSSELTISPSTDQIKENLTTFIETFNELTNEIHSNSRFSSDSEENGLLSEMYSIKTIPSALSSIMGQIIDTGDSITSLFNLGLSFNEKDGTISMEMDKFNEAFTSSLEGVKALFIGDKEKGINGLGDILNEALANYSDSQGVVSVQKSSSEERIDRIQTSIQEAEKRLDTKYEIQAEEFVRLDAYIGTMNAQSTYLQSIFDSFSESQKK